LGALASFSSRGPTADGRLKPDLTAPGVLVCVLSASNALGRVNGTSFATPLLAAAAALLKQLHRGLGPGALRQALQAYAANRTAPDSLRGWGRPDVAASAVFPTAITPLTPAGAVLASITPSFSWSVSTPPPYATPISYRLRIARDATFLYLVVDTVFQLPRPLERDAAYVWSLVVHAGADTTLVQSQGVFIVVDGSIPPTTQLYQNFPNPFPTDGREATCLWFDLAVPAIVELAV